VALAAACSGGDDDNGSDASSTSASTAPETAPLSILVTNDDGYAAEGIDTVVEALRELPDVTVTVVAPSENRSGSGGQTTAGALTATEEETASGYPATAVQGFPADSVAYGLAEVLDEAPDLVVSGINQGQNLGPIAAVSGTVGAAEAAASRGIPALAASQGLGEPPDFESAAELVVDWVEARRDVLADGTAEQVVVNLNVPTCPSGSLRGVKQVPLATEGSGIGTPPDCASTVTDVPDDVSAFLNGFASVTELTPEGQTVTSSTTWAAASG
jgi:5'-nucleotidase